MSTKGKYYRSKFRSNTIKIESNQSNEESVINIVNLPLHNSQCFLSMEMPKESQHQ